MLDSLRQNQGISQEPLILMPLVEGRPLIMYLIVLDNSMGFVLGQHDESSRKSIYYTTLTKSLPTVKQDTHFSRKLVAL